MKLALGKHSSGFFFGGPLVKWRIDQMTFGETVRCLTKEFWRNPRKLSNTREMFDDDDDDVDVDEGTRLSCTTCHNFFIYQEPDGTKKNKSPHGPLAS